jgi:hypothetical protein
MVNQIGSYYESPTIPFSLFFVFSYACRSRRQAWEKREIFPERACSSCQSDSPPRRARRGLDQSAKRHYPINHGETLTRSVSEDQTMGWPRLRRLPPVRYAGGGSIVKEQHTFGVRRLGHPALPGRAFQNATTAVKRRAPATPESEPPHAKGRGPASAFCAPSTPSSIQYARE